MGWDATLVYGSLGRDWGYTHNTNPIIERALGARVDGTVEPFWAALNPHSTIGRRSWWDLLDGCTGADGAVLLSVIVGRFDTTPDLYRALNPQNGWGDFDGLRDVLRQMRDASRNAPAATWRTSG